MSTARLYIASKPVYVGADPFRHLYFFYDQDSDNDQNPETNPGLIIRGGPKSNYDGIVNDSILFEINSAFIDSADKLEDGQDFSERGLRELFSGQAATDAWNSLISFAGTYTVSSTAVSNVYTSDFIYNGFPNFEPNSNSVINSLMGHISLDLRDWLPLTEGGVPYQQSSWFPGSMGILDAHGSDIFRAYAADNGLYTFYDSSGSDTIIIEHGARLEIMKDADAASTNHVVMLDQQLSLLTLLSPFGTDDLEVMQDNSGLSPVTLPLILDDQYGANGFAADTLEFRGDDDLLLHRINLALVPEDEATGSVSTFYTAFSDEADVTAGVGSDHVYGDTAANTLTGGRGSDTLRGNDGQDLYLWNLGDGSDRIIDDWAEGDMLDLGAGISNGWVTASVSGSDLLLNIADISGYGATLRIIGQAANAASFIASHVSGLVEEAAPTTSGAALWGTEVWHPELTPPAYVREDLNDTVTGTGGNESLEGRTGDDYLSGGAGDDKLDGGEGADTVHGDGGDDKLREIYSTGDHLYGDAGDDLLYAAYAAILDGGDDDDVIYAMGTGSTVTGGAGDDIVYAYASAVNGGTGENVIHLGAGASTVSVGDGDDTIYLSTSGTATITFAATLDAVLLDSNARDLVLLFVSGTTARLVDYAQHKADWTLPVGVALSDTFVTSSTASLSLNLALLTDVTDITSGSGNDTITGNSAANSITGGAGQDDINAGAGADIVHGGADIDLIDGGDGNDTLYGDAGNDDIDGGMGNNIIHGGDGDDALYGYNSMSGDDTIEGDGGNDDINGGGGTDTLSGGTGNDTIAGNGTLNGGADNDILTGTGALNGDAGADSITLYISGTAHGGDGNDTISSASGTGTLLYGDAGNDYLTGDSVTLYGGDDNDTLEGTGTLDGGAGNDIINGQGTLVGGTGADVITALYYTGSTVYGGTQGDTTGGDGHDTVSGSAAGDAIYVGASSYATGADGNDTVYAGAGSAIDGGDGDDRIYLRGTGASRVGVLDGTDTILLNDTLASAVVDFGTSFDASDLTYSYTPNSSNLTVQAGTVSAVLSGFVSAPTRWQVAFGDEAEAFNITHTLTNTTLAYGGNITITALANSEDVITTGGGADTILAYGGSDDIITNNGNDTVDAGAGNDNVDTGSGNDLIYLGDGSDAVNAGTNDDTVYGGAGDDQISGNAGNDYIDGDDGNDVIGGYDGNDTILSMAGNDYIYGGTGSDAVYLGASVALGDISFTRTASYLDPSSPFTDLVVVLSDGRHIQLINQFAVTSGVYAEQVETLAYGPSITTLDITSITPSSLDINGTSGANTLYGFNDTAIGDDRIYGQAGNDTIYGRGGSDELHGGNDNDVIYGDAGNDTLYGEAGNDYLSGGTGNNRLEGGDGADTLYGSTGNDIFLGGTGNDIVHGGQGADTFTGGTGSDTYVYDTGSVGAGVDTITDFSLTDADHVDLRSLLSGYDPVHEAITDFLTYTTSGGNTTFAIDTAGTGSNYTALVTLTGQTLTYSVEDMVAGGYLIVS